MRTYKQEEEQKRKASEQAEEKVEEKARKDMSQKGSSNLMSTKKEACCMGNHPLQTIQRRVELMTHQLYSEIDPNICFIHYDQHGTWVSCACGRWLHEDGC